MNALELKPVDRERYAAMESFLPPRIIDVHTHIWTGQAVDAEALSRTAGWASRVAAENSVENLLEIYRLLLPSKQVRPVVFGNPVVAALEPMNDYVADAARRERLPALALTRPDWPAEKLEELLASGGFLGAKPYLTYAPAGLPAADITIFDFLPPHQLDVLDRRGCVVVLHIPRPGRLKDPVNVRQLLEIEQRWPNLRVIVAHVGRAYCMEDIGGALDALAPAGRLCFDISANTNAEVFARLISAVGPKRILFGSDLPIAIMRMRRVCESGRYVNLVPPGLYGDVSGDPNMREVPPSEAAALSFFLYEHLSAFRRAAQTAGLSAADINDVFYANAAALLERARSMA